ncbi:hypothetical protein [Salmonirosea aquatica]|uniref:Uncharacterized protein n=1 Tax=Salmonirosea aquatica TaxID=2654236 RepID=A0A7C9BDS6_9BACT|nr:hypothetical protein [Cytophagaceae bacterium SJW1-29]
MKKLLVFLFLLSSCKQEAIDLSLGVVKGSINGITWDGKSQIRAYLATESCGEKKIGINLQIFSNLGLDRLGLAIFDISPTEGTARIFKRKYNSQNCEDVEGSLSLSNYDVFLDQVYVLEKSTFNHQITISRVDTVANIMEGNFQILFGDSENKERVLPDTVLVKAEFRVPITRLDL